MESVPSPKAAEYCEQRTVILISVPEQISFSCLLSPSDVCPRPAHSPRGCVNSSPCPRPRGWPGVLVTPGWGKWYSTVIMATARSFPFYLPPSTVKCLSPTPSYQVSNTQIKGKEVIWSVVWPCKKPNYLWSLETFSLKCVSEWPKCIAFPLPLTELCLYFAFKNLK